MQGRELKMLIEEAGKDFVGACIDSGNPVWTLEDPKLTLEYLHPYVLTSHIRDSYVWRVPEGAAVNWVRTGEGNVGIREFISKFLELCPGRALSAEIIVTGPRVFPFTNPDFWGPYRRVPAWEFSRFLAIADSGRPREPMPRVPKELAAQHEREHFEASMRVMQEVLGVA
jgi:hypothetical protein